MRPGCSARDRNACTRASAWTTPTLAFVISRRCTGRSESPEGTRRRARRDADTSDQKPGRSLSAEALARSCRGSRLGRRSRSHEGDRRLVRAGAVPVVGEAAQEHGCACCASASTTERSDDPKTEFDVVAAGAERRRRAPARGVGRYVDGPRQLRRRRSRAGGRCLRRCACGSVASTRAPDGPRSEGLPIELSRFSLPQSDPGGVSVGGCVPRRAATSRPRPPSLLQRHCGRLASFGQTAASRRERRSAFTEVEQAPAPPSTVEQGSGPIGTAGDRPTHPASLAFGEERVPCPREQPALPSCSRACSPATPLGGRPPPKTNATTPQGRFALASVAPSRHGRGSTAPVAGQSWCGV